MRIVSTSAFMFIFTHHNMAENNTKNNIKRQTTIKGNTEGRVRGLPYQHWRQPRWGCRGRIPTNILVGGDINGNVPTNIRGGNVVEYELLIASVKRKQR